MALISAEDALALALKGLVPLEAETVPIARAHGRVLAGSLDATLTQPPFDSSAMDGYAVRGDDVAALPATLTLVGESAAGSRFDGTLGRCEAVRIFTGAPVPAGADTVVIQEDTEASGNTVVVKEAAQGKHIRPRGQDFRQGDVLLEAGTRLGARAVMLAAAMNHAEVPVRLRPRVAILSTGDEVVPPGGKPGPDEIVASVSYGIAALVEAHGGEPIALGIAPDNREALAQGVARGADADILVTIGGASVGERDLVLGVLGQAGLGLDFAKVAMRPGKPVFSGRLGAQRVLGLPGNPVSALVCAYVFLVPMLNALLGVKAAHGRERDAVLGEALPGNGPRQHFLRAMSAWGDDGTRIVRPLPSQDSSLVAALAKADCLIVRAPGAPALPPGAQIEILPIFD